MDPSSRVWPAGMGMRGRLLHRVFLAGMLILTAGLTAGVLVGAPLGSAAAAASAGASRSWSAVVDEIEHTLGKAMEYHESGQPAPAKRAVDEAYFGPFEKDEMEQAVRTKISAKRAFELEYQFSSLKKLIDAGAPSDELKAAVNALVEDLRHDAAELDRSGRTPLSTFLYSFVIIVREGFEAILIISAIVAYLLKSGNSDKVRTIYKSAGWAVLASLVTALLLSVVFEISGAGQETLEGLTMLLAVVVLFWVSYWLISKAEAERWQRYIRSTVERSLSKGSNLALWFAAFLAVYREGAETVLFYRALFTGGGSPAMALLGLAAGLVVLVAIFAVVRLGSLRIPLKPFFMITSLLLYFFAFTLAGRGVHELQEAGLVATTELGGGFSAPALGIYPFLETLLPQAVLVVLFVAGLVLQFRGSRARRAADVSR